MLTGPLDGRPKKEIKTFSTMSKGLHELLDWLQEKQCTDAAMESTGIYWKPVYQVLEEGCLNIKLANAQRIKNVPGRKTDVCDSEWIAKLLRSGLIEGSFVPPQDIRELRDLTRYRKKLVQNIAAEKNRIQKFLESSGIKLSSVMSDVFGVTGRAILKQLLENGRLDEETIKSLARGNIKTKVPQVLEALRTKLSPHHRFLIRKSWEHLVYLEQSLEELDEMIDQHLSAYSEEVELISAIPGMNKTSVAAIIAEIGVDMNQFPSDRHIASWAGLSPGNNQSAGKKKVLMPHRATLT
jgi:transposase